LPDLVAAALESGLDPATPAVAVACATRPDERVIAAMVSDLPVRLAAEPAAGPVVVMIGTVFADYLERSAKHDAPSDEITRMRLAR
jgi:uroporphyrin-III C-methyltransferase / precorrin-2 dehydrogenase / sirohydrochlorin ferrochelatase